MFSRRVSTTFMSYITSHLFLYPLYVCILLLCVLLIPLSTSKRALAATSPITITSESASDVFAKAINFQVSVMDTNSPIIQATITVTTKAPTYSQQTYTVPVNAPGQSLQLHWLDDISGNNFMFSGTPLTYAWMFHDQNDHWFTGASQSYTVIDSRFPWQHLTQGELQVYWYGQGTDFGQIILSQALDNIKRISTNLGGGPTRPISLWIYQTSDDFRGALPPNTFEWVGGLAYPPLDEAFVVVDSPNAVTLVRDMPHELTHVIFHELVPLNDLVPTWFDEGLAVYNQDYREPEMLQRFNDALRTHTLLRFNTLADGFSSNSDTAYLAYAQSWQFISYMYNTFGIAKMNHLIRSMNSDSGTFDNQMSSALGEDSTQVENQWRISLEQPAILSPTQLKAQPVQKTIVPIVNISDTAAPWLISSGVLLILLSLFGIAGLFVYQRRRTRLASQSVGIYATQPVQPIPTQPMQRPQFYIPPTPEEFEQYTQSTIPFIDVKTRPTVYTDQSYYTFYDPSRPVSLATEQVLEQPLQDAEQHDIYSSEEEFPSFTFGQEYVQGQDLQHKMRILPKLQEPQQQAPQE